MHSGEPAVFPDRCSFADLELNRPLHQFAHVPAVRGERNPNIFLAQRRHPSAAGMLCHRRAALAECAQINDGLRPAQAMQGGGVTVIGSAPFDFAGGAVERGCDGGEGLR